MKRMIALLLLVSFFVVVPAQPSSAIVYGSTEEMENRLVVIDAELAKLEEERKDKAITAAVWTLIKGTAIWWYSEKEESRTFPNFVEHIYKAADSEEVKYLLRSREIGNLMIEKGWIYLLKSPEYIPGMIDKTAEMAGAAADKTKEMYKDVMNYFGW